MKSAVQRIATLSILASLAGGLGGCSRSEPGQPARPAASVPAPAPEPATKPPTEAEVRAALMRAVFGKDYRPDKGDALVGAGNQAGVFTAVDSTLLPSGETVLVVNGDTAEANGEAQAQQANGGSLNIYLLRETNGNWEVLRRHERVDELGHHGKIGQTRWVRQTNGRVLLAVEDGSSGQGYSVAGLALFDPAAEKIANLVGDNILIRSDNEGACTESSNHCWKAEAKWHTAPSTTRAAYDDLVLIFSGWEEKAAGSEGASAPENGEEPVQPAAEEASKRSRTAIAGAARYVFDNGAYRLKTGRNPIPSA